VNGPDPGVTRIGYGPRTSQGSPVSLFCQRGQPQLSITILRTSHHEPPRPGEAPPPPRNSNGKVTSNPPGDVCDSATHGHECPALSYPDGTVVTLTATPNDGSRFTGWSGACTGTSPTCTVTMDRDKSVTAGFDLTG
jgi:uncharacterized repeat protein (TIGR02543 family)